MASKKEIISDIELAVSKHKPSDDMEIGQEIISYRIDVSRDAYVEEFLNKLILANKKPLPAEYFRDVWIPLEKEEAAVVNKTVPEHYVAMPEKVMTLLGGNELAYIASDTGREIRLIDYKDIWDLRNMRFSKPSLSNIMCYRVDQKLYILGLEENYDQIENIYLVYCPSLTEDTIDENAEYPLYGELLELVVEDVVEGLRRDLTEGLYDIQNDGVQNTV